MAGLPIVITPAGVQPQSPLALLTTLLASVSAVNPGYTANLPGSLIEDISSTDVAAIALCDSAWVELLNSITPYGANAFLLQQLGQIYGLRLGSATNTSVNLVFIGTPGFVIAQGFTVSDGLYQYVVQNGGVIAASGVSALIYAVANLSGSWAVPSNTVTQLITSVPSGVTLTVTNPTAGVPATGTETETAFRSRTLQAGLAASQGMASYLKTLLANVSGVESRLISVRQQINQWEVLVGGGDPYQVAYAIYSALFDVSSLVGSTMNVTNVTNANPGVVTTGLNHGFSTGQVINISGLVGPVSLNNTPLTIVVIDQNHFSIGVNTTNTSLFPPYVSGGVVTPNLRNAAVYLADYPDAYEIIFVTPPEQNVALTVTWNTSSPNFVNPNGVSQLANAALVDYVNSIPVGAPINVFELDAVFQAAVVTIIPTALLTRLVFAVSINGIGVAPVSGTGIVNGDPESYFFTTPALVVISQG